MRATIICPRGFTRGRGGSGCCWGRQSMKEQLLMPELCHYSYSMTSPSLPPSDSIAWCFIPPLTRWHFSDFIWPPLSGPIQNRIFSQEWVSQWNHRPFLSKVGRHLPCFPQSPFKSLIASDCVHHFPDVHRVVPFSKFVIRRSRQREKTRKGYAIFLLS